MPCNPPPFLLIPPSFSSGDIFIESFPSNHLSHYFLLFPFVYLCMSLLKPRIPLLGRAPHSNQGWHNHYHDTTSPLLGTSINMASAVLVYRFSSSHSCAFACRSAAGFFFFLLAVFWAREDGWMTSSSYFQGRKVVIQMASYQSIRDGCVYI